MKKLSIANILDRLHTYKIHDKPAIVTMKSKRYKTFIAKVVDIRPVSENEIQISFNKYGDEGYFPSFNIDSESNHLLTYLHHIKHIQRYPISHDS